MGGIVLKGYYPHSQPTPQNSSYFWRAMGFTLLFGFTKKTRKQITFFIDLPSLCWLVDNVMTNWNSLVQVNWWVYLTLIVYRHWHVFFPIWWPTNTKLKFVLCENRSVWNFWLPQKLWQKMPKTTDSKFMINNDTWHLNIKHIKNNNIIVFKFTIVHYFHIFFIHRN